MNVELFGNFPGDQQWSMIYYGRALKRALRDNASPTDRVRLVVPSGRKRERGRLRAYWKRYALYPVLALRSQADVVHIVDHGYSYLVHALSARRTVITCHDLLVCRLRLGLLPGAPRPPKTNAIFERQIQGLRQAAHVVAVSQKTREDLMDFLKIPAQRISVVYSGIDPVYRPLPDDERGALRRQWGWDQWDATVLHVGGSVFYKNTPNLLRAMALLKERHLNVHLVKVARAWSATERQCIEQGKLDGHVHLQGPVLRHDLCRLYNAADVFAFPSWWEGFGWPPLEAMACGTPVVASTAGALSEILGGAAEGVDPAEPSELADKIQSVMESSARRQTLRERGLRRAAEFSWDRAAQALWPLYQRVKKESIDKSRNE